MIFMPGHSQLLFAKIVLVLFGKDIPAKSIQNMRRQISGLFLFAFLRNFEVCNIYFLKFNNIVLNTYKITYVRVGKCYRDVAIVR